MKKFVFCTVIILALLMVIPTTGCKSSNLSAQDYNQQAMSLAEQGKYEDAVKQYTKAINLDSKNAQVYVNRGIAYLNMKQFDLAIADFDKAIELDPKLAIAYANRGCAYANRGGHWNPPIMDVNLAIIDFNLAIMDFNKTIELSKNTDLTLYAKEMLENLAKTSPPLAVIPLPPVIISPPLVVIPPTPPKIIDEKKAVTPPPAQEGALPTFSDPDRIVIFPNQVIMGIIKDDNGTLTYSVVPTILRAYGGRPQSPGSQVLAPYKWKFPTMSSPPLAWGINMLSNGAVHGGGKLQEGTYTFTVEVTDGARTTKGTVTLQVTRYKIPPYIPLQQPLGMAEYPLPDALAGRPYGVTLPIVGGGEGKPPGQWLSYWFSIDAFKSSADFGFLGLSIDTMTGVLHGNVSAPAGSTLRLKVTVKGEDAELAPFAPVYTIKVVP